MIALADGDGRYLLTLAQSIFDVAPDHALDVAELGQLLQRRSPAYDKDREEHYNLISALHKSVRGSDPDAALYWLARMLEGGEDPLFIARRLMRMASEDIGEADPLSLLLTAAAKDAYDFLGSPEGELALAQACVHMAAAPKSNAVYTAFGAARKLAKETGSLMPPGPHPQRPDPADEGPRLRQGLPVRPEHARGLLRRRTTSPTAWSGRPSTGRRGRGRRRRSGRGSSDGRRCVMPRGRTKTLSAGGGPDRLCPLPRHPRGRRHPGDEQAVRALQPGRRPGRAQPGRTSRRLRQEPAARGRG